MTKWLVQKPTHRTTQKHIENQDATGIQKKYFKLKCLNTRKSLLLLFIIL